MTILRQPSERYELLVKLATGSVYTVYIGRDRRAGGVRQHIAIKIPHTALAGDDRARAEMAADAKRAANVRHANAVTVRDAEVAAQELLLVMDYIEGGSLATLAGSGDAPLPPTVALRIVLDACAGAHAVHEATSDAGTKLGLVHGEVAPQNLLVGLDGLTRVADVGLARWRQTGGVRSGPGRYAAPEQLRGETVDRRADVFALGVVLWELCAGEHPFRASSDEETRTRILTHVPRTLELPGDLGAVLARATSKAPAERYATAEALGDALHVAAVQGKLMPTHRAVAAIARSRFAVYIETIREDVEDAVALSVREAATPRAGDVQDDRAERERTERERTERERTERERTERERTERERTERERTERERTERDEIERERAERDEIERERAERERTERERTERERTERERAERERTERERAERDEIERAERDERDRAEREREIERIEQARAQREQAERDRERDLEDEARRAVPRLTTRPPKVDETPKPLPPTARPPTFDETLKPLPPTAAPPTLDEAPRPLVPSTPPRPAANESPTARPKKLTQPPATEVPTADVRKPTPPPAPPAKAPVKAPTERVHIASIRPATPTLQMGAVVPKPKPQPKTTIPLMTAIPRSAVPAKPDAAKPDAAKPDAAKPDAAKPDAAKPDVAKPDAAEVTSTQPGPAAPTETLAATAETVPESAPTAPAEMPESSPTSERDPESARESAPSSESAPPRAAASMPVPELPMGAPLWRSPVVIVVAVVLGALGMFAGIRFFNMPTVAPDTRVPDTGVQPLSPLNPTPFVLPAQSTALNGPTRDAAKDATPDAGRVDAAPPVDAAAPAPSASAPTPASMSDAGAVPSPSGTAATSASGRRRNPYVDP